MSSNRQTLWRLHHGPANTNHPGALSHNNTPHPIPKTTSIRRTKNDFHIPLKPPIPHLRPHPHHPWVPESRPVATTRPSADDATCVSFAPRPRLDAGRTRRTPGMQKAYLQAGSRRVRGASKPHIFAASGRCPQPPFLSHCKQNSLLIFFYIRQY